jgi:hypothetical protein
MMDEILAWKAEGRSRAANIRSRTVCNCPGRLTITEAANVGSTDERDGKQDGVTGDRSCRSILCRSVVLKVLTLSMSKRAKIPVFVYQRVAAGTRKMEFLPEYEGVGPLARADGVVSLKIVRHSTVHHCFY